VRELVVTENITVNGAKAESRYFVLSTSPSERPSAIAAEGEPWHVVPVRTQSCLHSGAQPQFREHPVNVEAVLSEDGRQPVQDELLVVGTPGPWSS
jgi:hypothetical protein